MPSFTVRPLAAEDVDQIVEWFDMDPAMWSHFGFDAPPTRGQLEQEMCRRALSEMDGIMQAFVVLADEDDLAGYLVVMPRVGTQGACHIIVAPHWRGHGVAIAKAGVEEARRRGYKTLFAIPSPRAHVSARWLRAVGFEVHPAGVMSLE